ncbi:MAG: DUF4390 domain-containing protein [Candidimonas sp.]|nr:MAG: DUF4390 domain-containing protein [Candidimonas sp.]
MSFRMLCAFVLCLLLAGQALAASPDGGASRVVRVDPVARNGELYIDVDTDLVVSSELRNVAEKGVPLYFTADLSIVSERWWWFDKTLVDKQRTWRIAYNALTRQWRIGTSDLTLPEPSFDDAMSLVRHIRDWAVAKIAALDPGKEYKGRIRVRLDTSLLARPFQIDAFNSSAWSLSTPWKDFTFSVTTGIANPS